MKIEKYQHGEANFWQIMGPMFASEEVYKAQGGYPMFSAPSTTWYLAFDGGELIGWVAIRPKANRMIIRFQYMPDVSDNNIWQRLIERCVQDNEDQVMETVEFKNRIEPYLQNSFVERQKRGKQFVVLYRSPR